MLEAFGLTDPGCVRANNEDCFLIASDIGLYIVADGMGGAQGGEHASRLATDFVSSKIRQSPVRDANTLVQSIQDANLAVMDAASQNSRLEGMGTTMVSLLEPTPAESEELWIASVGDSRAYLCDESGVRELTEDQTWVNEVGRRLGMDEDTLRTHPMRHVLTMAVGVSQPLRVNTYSIRRIPGLQILLCSDGLHGVVTFSEISEALLSEKQSLEEKCRQLIQAARDAGGPDNITTVLLRIV